jgi:hypothetical protein
MRTPVTQPSLVPARRSGRKPLAPGQTSVVLQVRCTEDQRVQFYALGGPAWFRRLVGVASRATEV